MARFLKGSEAQNPSSGSQLVPGPRHGLSKGLSAAISHVVLVSLWCFFPSFIIVPGMPGNTVRQAGFIQHQVSVKVTKPRSDVNRAAPSEAWKGAEVLGLVEGPGVMSYITYPVPFALFS